MNKNFNLIFIVLVSIILQAFLLKNLPVSKTVYPFLLGVPVTSVTELNYQFLLYWYLPISTITFFFSGYLNDYLSKYGVLEITRNFNIKKWVIKRFSLTYFYLLLITLFQLSVYNILYIQPINLDIQSFILISNYCFMLFVLISILLYLELYVSPQVALLSVNIYIIISILVTERLYDSINNYKILAYLSIPNYGMGFKTGYEVTQLNTQILNGYLILPMLMVFLLFILFLSVKKIQKLDIL